jgi:Protein of unknown function (DUF3987)
MKTNNNNMVGSVNALEVINDEITLEILKRYGAENPNLSDTDLYDLITEENAADDIPPVWEVEAFLSLNLGTSIYDGNPVQTCPYCEGELAEPEECERHNWHHPKRCECDQDAETEAWREYAKHFRNCLESNVSVWHDGNAKWTGQSFKPVHEPDEHPDEQDPFYFGGHTFRDHGVTQLIRSVSESTGVPEALCALMVLHTFSSGVGKGLLVSFEPGEVTSLGIYALALARSGTGKTKAGKILCGPLTDLHTARRTQWERLTKPRLQADRKILTSKIAKLIKQSERDDSDSVRDQMVKAETELAKIEGQLQAPCIYLEDVTVERLADLLPLSGEQMSYFSSDAGAAIQNILGKYNKDSRPDDHVLLKSYSMEPFSQARLSREDVNLRAPWGSLLWLTQPDKWQHLVGNQWLREGGFLPRCLLAEFHCEPQFNNGEQKVVPTALLEHFNKRFCELFGAYREPVETGAESKTIIVSSMAAKMMRDFHNEIVARRRQSDSMDAFSARWVENAKRIAGVLHASYFGADAHNHELHWVTVLYAIKAIRWFMERQAALLNETVEKQAADEEEKFNRAYLKSAKCINLRDLARNQGITESKVRQWIEEMKTFENRNHDGTVTRFKKYAITEIRNPNRTLTKYFHHWSSPPGDQTDSL